MSMEKKVIVNKNKSIKKEADTVIKASNIKYKLSYVATTKFARLVGKPQ